MTLETEKHDTLLAAVGQPTVLYVSALVLCQYLLFYED
jgi:hypothetical protein